MRAFQCFLTGVQQGLYQATFRSATSIWANALYTCLTCTNPSCFTTMYRQPSVQQPFASVLARQCGPCSQCSTVPIDPPHHYFRSLGRALPSRRPSRDFQKHHNLLQATTRHIVIRGTPQPIKESSLSPRLPPTRTPYRASASMPSQTWREQILSSAESTPAHLDRRCSTGALESCTHIHTRSMPSLFCL